MNSKISVLQEDIQYIIDNQRHLLDSFCGHTVLVAGATGLIGSQVIKTILAYNEIIRNAESSPIEVIGLSRNVERASTVFGDLLYSSNFHMKFTDVANIQDIKEEIDFIIHGANTTVSKDYVDRPVETINTIVSGTNQVLKLAYDKKVKKMVYLSTMEIYGRTKDKAERLNERDLGYIDILNVRSSYSEGKRMAECLCSSYAHEYNVPVVITRLAQVFGADVSKYDNRVFCQFSKSVINEEDIVLHTTGESMGNYCYTRDVVIALLLLLQKGQIGEVYNVVNEDTSIKIKDMAYLVANEIAKGKISVVFDIPKSTLEYGYSPDVTMRLSSKKIEKLGWKSTVPLVEMYYRLIRSYKEQMNCSN